jgi:hypothetical protein
MPFKIGDVFWIEDGLYQQEIIICPMCAGNKYVTVVLGSNEAVDIECECCAVGYCGSQGYIKESKLEPKAVRFEIAKVVEWRDGKWTVANLVGRSVRFDRLFETEGWAMASAVKRMEDLEESNMQNRRKKKYGKASTWSIRYHQRQIADAEKTIAWHRNKINAKKAVEGSDG